MIARSFAFIHVRNLVNESIPFLQVDGNRLYDAVTEGCEITADLETGHIRITGVEEEFQGNPPQGVSWAIQQAGGLVASLP